MRGTSNNRRRNQGAKPVGAGIGNTGRETWSGNRTTPNPEQQLTGFYIGQVMDDQDEQRNGRLWVYIPQISAARFDSQSLPTYGGTTPDRTEDGGLTFDQKLRNGWLMVSPISPFSGSDDYRNQQAPDGRNSASGDINSYGFQSQPRIGDNVAVVFSGGDPNSGYYFGSVPKANGMIPGVPGIEASQVSSRENNELLPQVQTEARIPAMDRTLSDNDPNGEDRVVSSDLARNIIRGGVSGDINRGAGTSGARRESPSYVTGMKSAGWSFDSERNNRNVDGQTRFGDQTDAYYDKNSVGHQFVLDDHPDYQSMRLRSSDGAQILFQDACETPYIYIQTQTGNAWIEIADSGDIMIYGKKGLHIHAEGDYNLTVDGDMNVGVRGNYNMRVEGSQSLGVTGSNTISIGEDMIMSVAGQYDFQTGDDARLTYNGDLDVRSAGDYNFTIGGGMDIVAGGGMSQSLGGALVFQVDGSSIFNTTGDQSHNVDGNINTAVGGDTLTNIGGDINLTAGGSMFSNSGGAMNYQGGGNFNVDASVVNLNSGSSSSATDAETEEVPDFFTAATAATPILPALNVTSGPPGDSEIIGNNPTGIQETIASVVPQHQPWGGRCGHGNTAGTNGLVTSAPQSGSFLPSSDNITCNRQNRDSNIRQGSVLSNSMVPNTVMGGTSDISGAIPIMAAGSGFRTDSSAESPVYRSVRLADERETHTPDSLSISLEGLNYIKSQETFIRRPQLDPLRGGYVVGYGHRISYGDSIGGSFLNSDLLKQIGLFSNDSEKGLEITQDEADTYLGQDIIKVGDWVTATFPEVEFTQAQYDTLISFVRNIGIDRMQSDEAGKAIIEGVNAGNFDQVQNGMLQYAYVGGGVDCNVLDRRRAEVGRMGYLPDRDGITGQAIGYVPDGETVTIGGFQITSTVFNAICNAQANISPQLPAGYLLTICAQESAFNPNARAGTSSAAGLFQFIRDTGARYGLSRDRSPSSNVFDPVLNANAGAQFNLDNYNTLVSVGVSNPNATDLYLAHFLGAGDKRARNGAARFLTQPGGAVPANDPAFRASAGANRSIFYEGGNRSTPRTYDQVYAVFERKIGKRLPLFENACSSAPPVTPAGDFKWVKALRQPDFYRVEPTVRAIAERSAIEAGITQLGFNSGYRSPSQNARADGAPNSQHLYGKAIDIHVGDLSSAQQRAFVERLAANGITGMGVGTNTIHVDTRNSGRVTWTYSGGNGHVRDILQRYGYRGA